MASVLKNLHLYTSPFSGCSARVRIALLLKNVLDTVPVTYHQISIADKEQQAASYRTTLNPNASVPTLVAEYSTEAQDAPLTITQSSAILDFLEDAFPSPALLPPHTQPRERARVQELASLVACDIQPPQNSRIRLKIEEDFGGDGVQWARYVYDRGFSVYEALLQKYRSGKDVYSVGKEVTLADVFLIPAAQGGLRVGIELTKWPILNQVVQECWKLEAFNKSGLGEHGRLIP